MPEMGLDPSALSSRPISTTPILPPKHVSAQANAAKIPKPSTSIPPYIDLEPFYTTLKAALGDNWETYKDALSHFFMGELNQTELSQRIDGFMISFTGETEHQHNQLIAGIYANITREIQPHTLAPWVSAHDKPAAGAGSKPITGDAAEQRLKAETMALHARDRRRIKDLALNEIDAFDAYASMLGDHRRPKIAKISHEILPPSAGGLNNLHKTNWEPEIRKRYAQALAAESGEFPDTSSIEGRMLPMCYENGLVSGHNSEAAMFMSVATETFVKQFLSSVFDKTRSNGPGAGGSAGSGGGANWITTHKYRRQLEREEEQYLRGEIVRDKSGLLPSEAKAAGERGSLGMADLRMALELGDCGIAQMPVVLESVISGYREGELEGWDDYTRLNDFHGMVLGEVKQDKDIIMNGTAEYKIHVNGINGVNGDNGDNGSYLDEDIEYDWGWEGAGVEDRDNLNNLLDSCLAV